MSIVWCRQFLCPLYLAFSHKGEKGPTRLVPSPLMGEGQGEGVQRKSIQLSFSTPAVSRCYKYFTK
jgi:hypothetical protein